MCCKHSYVIKGLVTTETGLRAAENRGRQSFKLKKTTFIVKRSNKPHEIFSLFC